MEVAGNNNKEAQKHNDESLLQAANTNDSDDERLPCRQCRICLGGDEDDDNSKCDDDPLIAPCNCKGSQQWVHRSCLDEWRATNPDHVAFSKCTECLTDYRLVYVGASSAAGRREYCCYVTRDIGIGCMALQCLMLSLGVLVWTLAGGITIDKSWSEVLLAELITGLVVVVILLGLYGSYLLCMNRCSLGKTRENIDVFADSIVGTLPERGNERPTLAIGNEQDTLASINQEQQHTCRTTPSQNSMNRSVQAQRYEPYISGRNHYHHSTDIYYCSDCCDDCRDCCDCCDCCDDCFRCCDDGSFCCPTNCCCCDGGGGGNNDNSGWLVVLLVVGAVLAALGLVVGFFLSCALLKGILDRHLFRLQKKRLTKNYVVKDLSNHHQGDVESLHTTTEVPPPPVMAPANVDDSAGAIPTSKKSKQSARVDRHKDYLRKLGLMDG